MIQNDHEAATLAAAPSGKEGPDPTLAGSGAAPRATPPQRLGRGATLGRYVVVDPLGEGGMGVVYAAYDPELDRRVAIKVVKLGGSRRSGISVGSSRLLREAQALAKLTHPNVVSVYDVGTLEASIFVAMEFVEGQTLSAWMKERQASGEIPWREVLRVLLPAGRGLAAAHAAGLVHRDFKPDNVMIAADGRVLVLDFGLARVSEDGEPSADPEPTPSSPSRAASQAPLTATGSVMGTPAYMSPEQFEGKVSDAASDQFSFCVTLYQALYGERPFVGETLPALTRAVITGELQSAPRGSRVPGWLRRVIVQGLSVDAEDRFASMDALLDALSRDPARRRNRVALGAGAVTVAVGLWWMGGRDAAVVDPCEPATLQVERDAMWGQAQRDALAQAFRRDAREYSEQVLERVTADLDTRAERWLHERHEACTAERDADPGTQVARDAALRSVCLEQARRRTEAVVRLLADADQQMVAKASDAVGGLPSAESCRDAEGYRQSAPVPDDPTLQEQVEALRLRKAEVEAIKAMGKVKEAVADSNELVEDARAIGFEPALAEMLEIAAYSAAHNGDYQRAQILFEEGLLLSVAHGHGRQQLHHTAGLVFLHTGYTSNLELAWWLVREMEALARRLGDEPSMRAQVLIDRARIERRQGELDKALVDFQGALDLLLGEDDKGLALLTVYINLATVNFELDRMNEAAAVLDAAQVVAERELGPSHPEMGTLLIQKARVDAQLGHAERSVEKMRRAEAIFRAAFDRPHPNLGAVQNGLGLQLEELGRIEEAERSYRQAIETMTTIFDRDHYQVAIVESNLGGLLRRNGKAEEALRLHEHDLEVWTQRENDAEQVWEIHDAIGDDLQALGRCEEAVPHYRIALERREAHGLRTPDELAYPRLGLGLCALGRGDLDEAETLLRAAIEGMVGRDLPFGRGVARLGLAMVLRQRDGEVPEIDALTTAIRKDWARHSRRDREELEALDRWRAGEPIEIPPY